MGLVLVVERHAGAAALELAQDRQPVGFDSVTLPPARGRPELEAGIEEQIVAWEEKKIDGRGLIGRQQFPAWGRGDARSCGFRKMDSRSSSFSVSRFTGGVDDGMCGFRLSNGNGAPGKRSDDSSPSTSVRSARRERRLGRGLDRLLLLPLLLGLPLLPLLVPLPLPLLFRAVGLGGAASGGGPSVRGRFGLDGLGGDWSSGERSGCCTAEDGAGAGQGAVASVVGDCLGHTGSAGSVDQAVMEGLRGASAGS